MIRSGLFSNSLAGAIQPDKAGLDSAMDGYRSPLYGTFTRQDDEYSGYFSSGEDTASEQGPLIRASNPCFDHPRLVHEKHATVFDLLRTPRLPLALIATIVMAIIFSALETVRFPISTSSYSER